MPASSDAIKVKAIVDIKSYQKLQQYLGCKNSDVELICYDDENNREESNVGTQIFNRTFNVTAGSQAQQHQQNEPIVEAVADSADAVEKEMEKSEAQSVPFRSLTHHVPPNYQDKAKKLLAALNLELYEGGTVSVDGQTYSSDSLAEIFKKLYGKKRPSTDDVSTDGRLASFLNSIESRKGLKRLIKNKKLLQKKHGGEQSHVDWWKF